MSVVDLWSHHSPYPTNKLPKSCVPPLRSARAARASSFAAAAPPHTLLCAPIYFSYNFLVKYPWLWRWNFMYSSPGFVHRPMFAAYGAIVARSFAAAFDTYDPDLVISVHPLMQHVPVRLQCDDVL